MGLGPRMIFFMWSSCFLLSFLKLRSIILSVLCESSPFSEVGPASDNSGWAMKTESPADLSVMK